MESRKALLCAALAVLPQAGIALEELLVTGTYSPRPALTASTTVLDAPQIAALNKRNVAGLLQTVPGLLVEEQGGPGGLTAVSVRGGESNFTLVLLDGVPVNDPTNSRGGSFDFANLNSALIERIEVVRGPRSAVYGSDALAGVINIVTRREEQGHRYYVQLEGGDDQFMHQGVAARGRVDAFDYAVELTNRDDGEPVGGSERESDGINVRLGWAPFNGQELWFAARYLDGERRSFPEQSGGEKFALSGDRDQIEYEDLVTSLGWRYQVTRAWHSSIEASRFDHEESFASPGIPPFFEVPPNVADTDFTRDQVRWVNTVIPRKGYTVNVGADLRREDGESDGFVDFFGNPASTSFELERDTLGLFAAVSARPFKPLLLHAGVRHDDPDEFDSETTYEAGIDAQLVSKLSVSANWGEAYKLPSFFALGNALVGNPDLEPERARSWDLGIAWHDEGKLELSLTAFMNDFEDLVDFDETTFRNVNRSEVETSGVELAGRWQPNEALWLNVYGTYTDIDVKGEDTTLTGRPEWSGGASASWHLLPILRTTLDYRYGGEQWSTSRHTGQEVTQKLDDYHRFDWVLEWRPDRHWRWQLSVDNLLDEDYETAVGFAAPGRALRVGVRYTN